MNFPEKLVAFGCRGRQTLPTTRGRDPVSDSGSVSVMTAIARRLPAAVAGLLLALSAANAGEQPHPIDAWLQEAIGNDASIADMRNATNQARERWEKEMNRAYGNVMAHLSADGKSALRESQRNWIRFRESEQKAIASIAAGSGGTLSQLAATDENMQLVRHRALQLRAYEQTVADE